MRIYRYGSQDAARAAGCHPSYGLEDTGSSCLERCEPIEVVLPEGYGTVECSDGRMRLLDPMGRVCELVANKDIGFWAMPMSGSGGLGLYIRVGDGDAEAWEGSTMGGDAS